MTLCGVLKNVILVIASVLIWGTVVKGLQVFGYTIALAGLVYYGVGYEDLKTSYEATIMYAKRTWKEQSDSAHDPRSFLTKRSLSICLYIVIAVLLLSGFAYYNGKQSDFTQDVAGIPGAT